jgi:hypothetical protein
MQFYNETITGSSVLVENGRIIMVEPLRSRALQERR